MSRYYRQDLRDLWRDDGGASRLTWRRLGVLINGLPPESATKTALRDALSDDELTSLARTVAEGHGQWSHMEMLLALLADRLGQLVWLNSDGKGDRPEPIQRPGVPRKTRILTPKAMEYLDRLRRNHGAVDQIGA
jgi:hypothetical protein